MNPFPFFSFSKVCRVNHHKNTHTKRRWKKKKKLQMKNQRNYLMLFFKEMKNLSKFFLAKKTNNSNLISTFNSKRWFFFGTFFLSFPFFYLSLSPFFLKLLFVKFGWTVLHFAAFTGKEGIVKILVGHGPNVDLQDKVLI